MSGPHGLRGLAVDLVARPARPCVATVVALWAVLVGAGCDHFRVESFHGAKVLFTMGGARPTAPGHHLELWARESYGPDDVRQSRLTIEGRHPDGTPCGAGEFCPRSAYTITQAIAFTGTGDTFKLTDGCMIDALGHLQWEPDAFTDLTPPACHCQPQGVTPRSRPVTPDLTYSNGPQGPLGAAAVMRRVHQLTDLAPSPLLVFASWDDQSANRPPVDRDPPFASPSERLQTCCDYWCDAPFAYSGNVIQTSAPIHGALYGTLDFQSVAPAQLLGGVSISVDYSLRKLDGLWLTDTTASIAALDPRQLDCNAHPDTCAGAVLVNGTLTDPNESGRGLLHFDLTPPVAGGPSGAAVVHVGLDEDPSQF